MTARQRNTKILRRRRHLDLFIEKKTWKAFRVDFLLKLDSSFDYTAPLNEPKEIEIGMGNAFTTLFMQNNTQLCYLQIHKRLIWQLTIQVKNVSTFPEITDGQVKNIIYLTTWLS